MEWYVTQGAIGGGDGSVGSPWTYAEAILAINNSTVSNQDRVNIKDDGVVYDIAEHTITRSGAGGDNIVTIEGYSTNPGDGGRPTLRRSGGTGVLCQWSTAEWFHYKNLIIDGNNSGTDNITPDRYTSFYRVTSHNAGRYGFFCEQRVNFINCVAYNNGNSGWAGGSCFNCLSYDNGGNGWDITSGVIVNCIAKNNVGNINLGFAGKAINCIADGGTGNCVSALYGSTIMNIIAINSAEYSFSIDKTSLGFNCNGYNHTSGNQTGNGTIQNLYNINPSFNDTTIFDYTKTSDALDGLGFSDVGIQGVDLKIDQGLGRRLTDYPSEDDVRLSVQYSHTGLTGNLVSPSESNVQDGFQYGANGTEYTGTLSVVDQEISYPLELTIEEDGEIEVTVEVD